MFLRFNVLDRQPELNSVGHVSVQQRLTTRKRNFQAGISLSDNLPVVVTLKQGKVVMISEAKDQRGGELAFENGETLSYEGRSQSPPRFLGSFI